MSEAKVLRQINQKILDRIGDSVYVCDNEGRLVYVNPAAGEREGNSTAEIYGKTVVEVYGLDETVSPLLKALYRLETIEEPSFSYRMHGSELKGKCSAFPLFEGETVVGACAIFQFPGSLPKPGKVQNEAKYERTELIGRSPAFVRCRNMALQAAAGNSSVMLMGETGSGKELFARFIHGQSNRSAKPFLALNCAAIPEDLLEGILFGTTKGVYTGAMEKEGILAEADGGTVFLDEINSMPMSSQAKLLRVLEERRVTKLGSSKSRPIDVRIISSANDTALLTEDNTSLRKDLFYRLSVVYIDIPPLRRRKEDIPLLVDEFIKEFNCRFGKNVIGVADEVADFMMAFPWPGNVRQLRHCLESAINFTDSGQWIGFSSLPPYLFETEFGDTVEPKATAVSDAVTDDAEPTVMSSIRLAEKEEIAEALKNAKGNMAKAARSLGMDRQAFVYRVKKYHLK